MVFTTSTLQLGNGARGRAFLLVGFIELKIGQFGVVELRSPFYNPSSVS